MGLRRFLLVLTATALLAACRAPRRVEPPTPSPVVLISLDTLRADRLNGYGYTARKVSPNIDALAADGILFENHISAAPWTVPSHISLLTSLWPSSHGVTGSLRELQDAEYTYQALSEARTTLAELLATHGYTTGAFTAGDTLAPHFGYAQGFTLYRTNMLKLHSGNVGEMTRWVDANRSRPFFLFWHTFEPHAPYIGTQFLAEVLPPAQAELVREAVERYGDRLRKGVVHAARFEPLLAKRNAFNRDVSEALYMGAVRESDRWVGTILDELRRRDLYDRTLIILTSDHGEEFGERSPKSFYNAHGHTLWRELVRVPLIVKLPGKAAAGTRVSALSRSVDVMPTVLDVLHVPGGSEMQGESLRPLWEKPGSSERVAFLESLEEPYEEKGVQNDRYKYLVRIGAASVANHGRGHLPPNPEWRGLYDLQQDPQERVNLLQGTVHLEHERLAEGMDALLRKHVSAQRADTRPARFSPEAIERLRALGYVE